MSDSLSTREELRRHRYAVIVAGGSGTRLWPLSRQNLPKQMQALMSDKTLIAETVDRLRGAVPMENVYISTTGNYLETIRDLLPDIASENIICEPVARGTSAAFALIAHHLHEKDPQAVIFSLASDHAITEVDKFQETLDRSFEFIEQHPRQIAMVGIRPTRADTGLGYIKVRHAIQDDPLIYEAEKFVEKPTQVVAEKYVESGEYFWNAAYYCFYASTLLEAYEAADPRLTLAARAFSKTGVRSDYEQAPDKVHEIEIIDSATYPLAVVPAEFTWSDIGNWLALYMLLSDIAGDDVVSSDASRHVDVNSKRLMVSNPDGRLVATAGLEDVIVVSTEDAVLVLHMSQLETVPETMRQLLTKLAQEGKEDYL